MQEILISLLNYRMVKVDKNGLNATLCNHGFCPLVCLRCKAARANQIFGRSASKLFCGLSEKKKQGRTPTKKLKNALFLRLAASAAASIAASILCDTKSVVEHLQFLFKQNLLAP